MELIPAMQMQAASWTSASPGLGLTPELPGSCVTLSLMSLLWDGCQSYFLITIHLRTLVRSFCLPGIFLPVGPPNLRSSSVTWLTPLLFPPRLYLLGSEGRLLLLSPAEHHFWCGRVDKPPASWLLLTHLCRADTPHFLDITEECSGK